MQKNNIGFEFFELAKGAPDRAAILAEDAFVSYKQLRNLSAAFALHMQDHGVNNSSTICVRTNDIVVMLAAVFASALLGARWSRMSKEVKNSGKVKLTHIFETNDFPPSNHPLAIKITNKWGRFPADYPVGTPPKFPGFVSEDDGWMITHTSGTTGTPKFVEVSQKVMMARALESRSDMPAEIGHGVCLFAIQSFPFVVRSLTALMNGATIVHSQNPMFWIEKGVTLVTGSPAQVAKLFEKFSLKQKLPLLHIGGSKVSESMIRELLDSFDEVVDLYGSTETSRVFKNSNRLSDSGDIQKTSEILDAEIEIVGEDGQRLPADTVGQVRVRSGQMVHGYLDSPDAQAHSFRDGWFYPGDLGSFDDTGALVIQGRRNDLLNCGGVKINAIEIDACILEVQSVVDAIAFAVPKTESISELFALVRVDLIADRNKVKEEIIAACKERFGLSHVPQRIIFTKDIPRTESGKPNRTMATMLALERRIETLGGQVE